MTHLPAKFNMSLRNGGVIMSKLNYTRNGCKDVFNAFMVSDAEYAGKYELPVLLPTNKIPNKLIAFTEALKTKDYDQWVHFYIDDVAFERIWKQPRKYLPILKKFNGVILPDFSLYRDMPFVMQIWNIYRSRAIGHWFQREGIEIIINIRFGDDRTYRICCDGAPKNSIIAIGTHGTLKGKIDRHYLLEGLDKIIEILHPTAIVIYGAAPDKYFKKYKEMGIIIHQFDSDFAKSRKKEVD